MLNAYQSQSYLKTGLPRSRLKFDDCLQIQSDSAGMRVLDPHDLRRISVWKGFLMSIPSVPSVPSVSNTPSECRIDFNDSDVRHRVERFLYSRDPSAFRSLVVEVRHGRATLAGAVDTFYEKQIALNACQRVAGVLTTIDQIDVAESIPLPKPR